VECLTAFDACVVNSKRLSSGLLMELGWKESRVPVRKQYSVDCLAAGELLRDSTTPDIDSAADQHTSSKHGSCVVGFLQVIS